MNVKTVLNNCRNMKPGEKKEITLKRPGTISQARILGLRLNQFGTPLGKKYMVHQIKGVKEIIVRCSALSITEK